MYILIQETAKIIVYELSVQQKWSTCRELGKYVFQILKTNPGNEDQLLVDLRNKKKWKFVALNKVVKKEIWSRFQQIEEEKMNKKLEWREKTRMIPAHIFLWWESFIAKLERNLYRLKVVFATISQVCFLRLREHLWN